jgi:cell fate regulator YaaT (PSP1 superfamily)
MATREQIEEITVQQRLERWLKLKGEIKKRGDEMKLIDSFFNIDKNKMSGSAIFPGVTLQMKVSYGKKTEVDQELAEKLCKTYSKTPFKVEYKLDKKLYDSMEELNPEAHGKFKEAVTFKPNSPSKEVTEIKK